MCLLINEMMRDGKYFEKTLPLLYADRFLWVIAISFKRLARFEEWQNQTPAVSLWLKKKQAKLISDIWHCDSGICFLIGF